MSVTIRAARMADAGGMAQVFVDAFRAGHQGQMPDWLLETRTYETSERGWARTLGEMQGETDPETCLLVAEDETGELVGVAMGGPAQPWDDDRAARAGQPTGEVYLAYVSPMRQRRGIGRELVGRVALFLVGRGMRRLVIGVLAANAPARRFYEALGGRLLGHRPFVDEGVILEEAVYVWPDARALLPDNDPADA